MVDADLQDLLGDDADDEASGDDVQAAPRPAGTGQERDVAGSDGGCVDVDELVETLQGVPVEDAEWEVREALKKATGQVPETDVLGIMLRVFKSARDDAINGYGDWEDVVSYCDRLTQLCDKGFVGHMGGEPEAGHQDLPAAIVATIYAECGRSLALANRLRDAQDKLQKALNVFAVVPQGQGGGQDDAATGRQVAAATASMARVLRRLGGGQGDSHTQAREHYMKALQLYAVLPGGDDTLDFLSELCEFIGEAGDAEFSPTLPSLVADIAEDRFGEGTESHMQMLREVSQVCADVGRQDVAVPMLVSRARILRSRCGPGAGAMEVADVETAEEEAADVVEASVPALLEAGDLEAAADRWEIALCLRESAQGPDSDIVEEMRSSLVALRQAASAGAGGDPDVPRAPPSGAESDDDAEEEEDEEEEEEDRDKAAAPTRDTATAFSAAGRGVPPSRSAGYTRLDSEVTGMSLRPAWMSRQPPRASAQAADDAWDD